jgi:hypothetical protein
VLLGRDELDSQTALELSTLTKNWLDAIYAHQEYDLKLAAQGGGGEQVIRIENSLPQIPGTNIIGMGGSFAISIFIGSPSIPPGNRSIETNCSAGSRHFLDI